jgi:signal transduction histidine kinase
MFANTAMRQLLGSAPAGAPLPDGHPLRPVLGRAVEKRSTEGPVSLSLPLPSGDFADFLVTVHAFADRQGRFIGAMITARNMAYLTQVQSTLRYSRKVAALGRLLAGVAHEVKNPLNAMTIHLELLKQKLGAGSGAPAAAGQAGGADAQRAGAMKHVTVIANEIRRLDTAVQGFLKFSRPEELALSAVALRPLCDDVSRVIEPEARAQHVTVENACAADVPAVYADPAMLRQAILNLALNAIQAMPSGGALRFAARRASGRNVELTVSDTGVGIDADHLPRIFDLYFTTKDGGTGLGLSMVYRTVHLHDGTIEVESTPGHGTVFRVQLPQA